MQVPTTFLTPEQVAGLLHLKSTRSLERWRADGTGPAFVKLGKRCLYAPADVEQWIAEQPRRRSTSEAA